MAERRSTWLIKRSPVRQSAPFAAAFFWRQHSGRRVRGTQISVTDGFAAAWRRTLIPLVRGLLFRSAQTAGYRLLASLETPAADVLPNDTAQRSISTRSASGASATSFGSRGRVCEAERPTTTLPCARCAIIYKQENGTETQRCPAGTASTLFSPETASLFRTKNGYESMLYTEGRLPLPEHVSNQMPCAGCYFRRILEQIGQVSVAA